MPQRQTDPPSTRTIACRPRGRVQWPASLPVSIRIDYLVLSLLSYLTGMPAETLAADRTLLGQAAAPSSAAGPNAR